MSRSLIQQATRYVIHSLFCFVAMLIVPAFAVAQAGAESVIDFETFNQILDLDEDDTHDFSLGMAEAYFTQASTTFKDMDTALYVDFP